MKNLILIVIVFVTLSHSDLLSQPVEDFGYADMSIPALSQFDYYRGVWQSELKVKQSDGTFKKLEGGATIVGRFLDDHKTFQSQFNTPNGFFSTDIRTYNVSNKRWEALFLNANDQR